MNWISVLDKLPKEGKRVIIWDDQCNTFRECYYNNKEFYISEFDQRGELDRYFFKPKLWMIPSVAGVED